MNCKYCDKPIREATIEEMASLGRVGVDYKHCVNSRWCCMELDTVQKGIRDATPKDGEAPPAEWSLIQTHVTFVGKPSGSVKPKKVTKPRKPKKPKLTLPPVAGRRFR